MGFAPRISPKLDQQIARRGQRRRQLGREFHRATPRTSKTSTGCFQPCASAPCGSPTASKVHQPHALVLGQGLRRVTLIRPAVDERP